MKKTALQRALPHLIALGIFLLMSVLYFLPQTQGKLVPQGDIISHRWISHEAIEYEKKTGELTQWTNAAFSGMPTYQIYSPNKSNLLQYLEPVTNLFIDRPIGYFIAMMLGMYILLATLGINSWLAIIGSIAFGFTTNNFVLFEAGHMSKLRAVAFLAPVVAGIIQTYRGNYWWGGVLFAASMGLEIYCNHPQMTYYLALVMLVFVVWQFVADLRAGKIVHFAKASAILLLGSALAIGASWSKLSSTLEYSEETMRGGAVLTAAGGKKSKGLEWDYAMQWSNGIIDAFSTLIPGVAGGGSQEPVGKDSAFAKFMKSRGGRVTDDLKAPLYWGALPFTSGPNYFGAGVFFLFLLGLFLVKGQMKWWLAIATVFTLLISMGKNFEVLNRLLFDYLPMFNNFRAHTSVLSLTPLLMTLLGILTVSNILQNDVTKTETMRALKISAGISLAICLFFALIGPSHFDFNSESDGQLLNNGYDLQVLMEDRRSLMRMDAFRSLALILLTAGLIWAFVQSKIKQTHLLLGLGLVFTFDLWMVGRRYLDDSSFITKAEYDKNFQPRQCDLQILKDTDPNFRVFDLSVDAFQSAQPSYFHKNIGGYHPAKLQRYQDVISQYLVNANQRVLDMLNMKYYIDTEQQVNRNQGALGNAWFVSNIKLVGTPELEIGELANFIPGEEAIVHEEFMDYLNGYTPQEDGTITLTEYRPNRLTYKVDTHAEQFAVFSEIWYGPNKGWQAYLDGKPVDHIRANYILRGMRVPPGKHEIVFEFKPAAITKGNTVSMISSGILLFALLGMFGYGGWNWYKNLPEEVAKPVADKPKTEAAKTKKGKR